MRDHTYLLTAIVMGLAAAPAAAITIISQSANADITIGLPFDSLEFEDPLTGTETVKGYKLLEWQDADYSPGPPRWYDEWSVNNPAIDGSLSGKEIYLRGQGHAAWTSTTVSSEIVSIHLNADDNDGLAQVLVDGVEVARFDMYTSPCCKTALIIVTGLSNT
ncbi:MAG: hypothetical protein HY718_11715, partial [Planctomycetes bacterium]|nr:hypothetical protein [Planctomycetota bacterium]